MPTLAHKVRHLRHALGLTQQALADDCGGTARAISMLEHGQQTPYAQTLWRIAQRLGVTVDYLLGPARAAWTR